MRKAIEITVGVTFIIFWLFAVASINWIPERCCVCGKQEGANPAENLRTLSLIEWGFDSTIDLHWSCQNQYDGEKHSPDRTGK